MSNKSDVQYDKPRWGIIRSFILLLIRVYKKVLSPSFGSQCRFYPTCSSYALLLFTYYPMYKAFYLSVYRILRCNPYNPGGVDFPPGISLTEANKHLNSQ